jgi:hypothetical protein
MRNNLLERENEYKRLYTEQVKHQFTFMSKESLKLRHIVQEVSHVYEDISKVQGFMERLDDYAIVGACQKIRLFESQF